MDLVRRRWNWVLWIGFVFVLAAFFSYAFFLRFPVTRDFPWANLLLFAAGGFLLGLGLARAFRQPEHYRGRIFGPLFAALSLILLCLFSYGLFYVARQLPAAAGAPRVGSKAPAFTLPDQDGNPTALHDLLSSPGTRAAVLIFYRGYW